MVLSACGQEAKPTDPPVTTEPVQATQPGTEKFQGEEYTEPLVDGYNQVTFYWTYPGTYENCDIWIWWGE